MVARVRLPTATPVQSRMDCLLENGFKSVLSIMRGLYTSCCVYLGRLDIVFKVD
jgi:hypothetical protein